MVSRVKVSASRINPPRVSIFANRHRHLNGIVAEIFATTTGTHPGDKQDRDIGYPKITLHDPNTRRPGIGSDRSTACFDTEQKYVQVAR